MCRVSVPRVPEVDVLQRLQCLREVIQFRQLVVPSMESGELCKGAHTLQGLEAIGGLHTTETGARVSAGPHQDFATVPHTTTDNRCTHGMFIVSHASCSGGGGGGDYTIGMKRNLFYRPSLSSFCTMSSGTAGTQD